jgi:hypothetical protein
MDSSTLNVDSGLSGGQESANPRTEGRVRPFVESDIPEVARLHNKVWNVAGVLSPELMEDYRAFLTQAFLLHPWKDGPFCSLVHEDSAGRITGFLGSLPREMRMNGESVRLRLASQFFVDSGSRGFVGIRLAKTFLDGPQDISLTDEANVSARMIWERFGGTVCSFSSLRWIAVLRPCSFGLVASRKAGLLNATLTRGLTPVARLLDFVGSRIPIKALRPIQPKLSGEELDCETLTTCLTDLARRKTFRPEYNTHTVNWLLKRASELRGSGSLQKVLVRAGKTIAGWYVYYLNPQGLSEVVQLCAKDPFADGVLEHLFHHARRQGASALIGRPEANLLESLHRKHCLLYSSPRQWMLVHSRRPELVNAFLSEDVFFTRLDGEWCLHFR